MIDKGFQLFGSGIVILKLLTGLYNDGAISFIIEVEDSCPYISASKNDKMGDIPNLLFES